MFSHIPLKSYQKEVSRKDFILELELTNPLISVD